MDTEKIAERLSKRIIVSEKMELVDTITIKVEADNPELFTSEDGLQRLGMSIDSAVERELDRMKKIPVGLKVTFSSKSGDFKGYMKNF